MSFRECHAIHQLLRVWASPQLEASRPVSFPEVWEHPHPDHMLSMEQNPEHHFMCTYPSMVRKRKPHQVYYVNLFTGLSHMQTSVLQWTDIRGQPPFFFIMISSQHQHNTRWESSYICSLQINHYWEFDILTWSKISSQSQLLYCSFLLKSNLWCNDTCWLWQSQVWVIIHTNIYVNVF